MSMIASFRQLSLLLLVIEKLATTQRLRTLHFFNTFGQPVGSVRLEGGMVVSGIRVEEAVFLDDEFKRDAAQVAIPLIKLLCEEDLAPAEVVRIQAVSLVARRALGQLMARALRRIATLADLTQIRIEDHPSGWATKNRALRFAFPPVELLLAAGRSGRRRETDKATQLYDMPPEPVEERWLFEWQTDNAGEAWPIMTSRQADKKTNTVAQFGFLGQNLVQRFGLARREAESLGVTAELAVTDLHLYYVVLTDRYVTLLVYQAQHIDRVLRSLHDVVFDAPVVRRAPRHALASSPAVPEAAPPSPPVLAAHVPSVLTHEGQSPADEPARHAAPIAARADVAPADPSSDAANTRVRASHAASPGIPKRAPIASAASAEQGSRSFASAVTLPMPLEALAPSLFSDLDPGASSDAIPVPIPVASADAVPDFVPFSTSDATAVVSTAAIQTSACEPVSASESVQAPAARVTPPETLEMVRPNPPAERPAPRAASTAAKEPSPIADPLPGSGPTPPPAPIPISGPVPISAPAPAPAPLPISESIPISGPVPISAPAPAPAPLPISESIPISGSIPISSPVPISTPAPDPTPLPISESIPISGPISIAEPVRVADLTSIPDQVPRPDSQAVHKHSPSEKEGPKVAAPASDSTAVQPHDAALLSLRGVRIEPEGWPSVQLPDLRIGYHGLHALVGLSARDKSVLLGILSGHPELEADVHVAGSIQYDGSSLGSTHHPAVLSAPIARSTQSLRAYLQTGLGNTTAAEDVDVALHDVLERTRLSPFLPYLGDPLAGRTLRPFPSEWLRLALARQLLTNPRLICLDDPTAGLNVADQDVLWSVLRAEAKRRAVLVFLQDPDEAAYHEAELHLVPPPRTDSAAPAEPQQDPRTHASLQIIPRDHSPPSRAATEDVVWATSIPVLRLRNFAVSVSGRTVLSQVNLDLADCGLHVLVGPENTLRRTFVRALCGPRGNHIELHGHCIFGGASLSKDRELAVPSTDPRHALLTVGEYLSGRMQRQHGALREQTSTEIAALLHAAGFAEITKRLNIALCELDPYERRVIEILAVAATQPLAMVLRDVLQGLPASQHRRLLGLLSAQAAQHTILLCTDDPLPYLSFPFLPTLRVAYFRERGISADAALAAAPGEHDAEDSEARP